MTLWKSPSFIPCVRENPEKVLLSAYKLRNSLLFREALVHVVSQWKGWHEVLDGEHRLICTITKARNDVLEKALCVNRGVFNIVGSGEDGDKEALLEVLREWKDNYMNKCFFEKLLDFICCGEGKNFADAVRDLVGSKLVLEPFASGVIDDDGLMCAEIEEADLPWDLNKEDW
jgi:hypothetical protein